MLQMTRVGDESCAGGQRSRVGPMRRWWAERLPSQVRGFRVVTEPGGGDVCVICLRCRRGRTWLSDGGGHDGCGLRFKGAAQCCLTDLQRHGGFKCAAR